MSRSFSAPVRSANTSSGSQRILRKSGDSVEAILYEVITFRGTAEEFSPTDGAGNNAYDAIEAGGASMTRNVQFLLNSIAKRGIAGQLEPCQTRKSSSRRSVNCLRS